MRRCAAGTLVLVAVLGVLAWVGARTGPGPGVGVPAPADIVASGGGPGFRPLPTVMPSPIATLAADAGARTDRPALDPPAREDYVRDARKNLHGSPAVLNRFSARMAKRMRPALESREEAESFFGELRECALDDRSVEPVLALCAINAARLAERFPEGLAEKYRALRERLASNVAESVGAAGY